MVYIKSKPLVVPLSPTSSPRGSEVVMSRLSTSILVILVLLALILNTVVEAKKGKRYLEEKSLGRQKNPSKRHESSVKGKEERARRWKEDKMTSGKQDEFLEITNLDLDKRVKGGKHTDTKARFPEVKKDNLKNLCKSERTPMLCEEEVENIPTECKDMECRSKRDCESTGLERMEEDDPQEECLLKKKENRQKRNLKCEHDETILANEESEGNCYYGL